MLQNRRRSEYKKKSTGNCCKSLTFKIPNSRTRKRIKQDKWTFVSKIYTCTMSGKEIEDVLTMNARMKRDHPILTISTGIKGEWFSLKKAAELAKIHFIALDKDYNIQDAGTEKPGADSILNPLHKAVACACWYNLFYTGTSLPTMPKDLAAPFLHCIASWTVDQDENTLFKISSDWPAQGEQMPVKAKAAIIGFRTLVHDIVTKIPDAARDDIGPYLVTTFNLSASSDLETRFLGFWDVIWRQQYLDIFGYFLAYFLRIMVREPKDTMQLYHQRGHFNGLFNFCRLPKDACFRTLEEMYLAPFKNDMDYYRPTIGNYLAVSYNSATTADREVFRKYFGLRFEFFGMANISFCKRIKKRLDLIEALAVISTKNTFYDIKRIIYSILIYVEKSAAVITDASESVECPATLTKHDIAAGQFARLYSPEFMTWLTFARTEFLSTRLAGLTLGIEKSTLDFTPYLVDATRDEFLHCYMAGKLMMMKSELEDPHVSDTLKEIIRDSLANTEKFGHLVPDDAKLANFSDEQLRSWDTTPAGHHANLINQHTMRGVQPIVSLVPQTRGMPSVASGSNAAPLNPPAATSLFSFNPIDRTKKT
ncbi:nucleocapsid protein [Potato cyst nematode rhabdovirus]|nr:nucleocapsid protein [Potato cyst nematode rhabdovirus]DAZ92281.1 TPA_asm: nucleocapsid protein [Potato cyst nematode rhabdovirus]